MSRYTGPKLRIMRALGMQLPGLSAKSIEKRQNPPGQHGGSRVKRKPSLYGRRLREKQKLRFHYGVTERQMRTIAEQASRTASSTGTAIVRLLEQRIDNIVFRAGFARTIPAARQLVSHGHVTLNGRRLDVPSARLRPGDVVVVKTKAHEIVRLQQSTGTTLAKPDWLAVDDTALSVRVVSMPDETAIPFPIEIGLVVEFYS